MPCDLYELRLIDRLTRKPFPAEPLWTGFQLSRGRMVSFLRLRNRQGFDVYLRPYADQQNAGYILVDLDTAAPSLIHVMRTHGHEPCVVLQTSTGRLQAWVRVSPAPLPAALATAIAKDLAHRYHADRASADWRHVGRLAGFTNRKSTRLHPNGYAPWVKLVHAQAQLATHGPALLAAAQRQLSSSPPPALWTPPHTTGPSAVPSPEPISTLTPVTAAAIYQRFLERLRIPQRFPQPDWSIADLWIAKELLRCRTSAAQVHTILRLGSPGFPRRHSQPEDYLARTLRRAALELEHARFSARPRARCVQVDHNR
jgi:RepB DNA-primase from phage plasmid